MQKYTKKLNGVCPAMVEFSISDNKTVHEIKFLGGCSGNLQAVSALCEGKTVTELHTMLNGIKCGPRPTSCSNELVNIIKTVSS